jgi:hypothetical protein
MPDRHTGRTSVRTRKGARTAFSAVLRALSDYALTAVPTDSDRHAEPKEWITIARRVRALSQETTFRAVVLALESGASWYEVAGWLGHRDEYNRPDEDAVRRMFELPYEEWKNGVAQAWTPDDCIPVAPDAEGDPDAVAQSLDAWYTMRTGGGHNLHVVSGNLF